MNQKNSPLLIWVIFFVICAAALCSAIVYSRATHRLHHLADFEMKRIQSVRFDPAKLNVLILGNSLTQCAFPLSEKEIASSLKERFSSFSCDGTEVEVVNLAYTGSALIYLENYFDSIFATKPDILILQVDLAVPWQGISGVQRLNLDFLNVSNLIRPVVTTNIRKFTKTVRKPFQQYLPEALRASNSKTQSTQSTYSANSFEKRPEFGAEEDIERKLNVLKLGPTKTGRVLAFSRQVIQKALQKGITVMVLGTPRSIKITSRLSGNVFEEQKTIVQKLFAPNRSVYIQFPRVLPDNYFEDSRHLNTDGMRVFFSWFSGAFVREYMSTHSCRS